MSNFSRYIKAQAASTPSDEWVRNPDWIAIPDITNGDNKMYGVMAVYENETNEEYHLNLDVEMDGDLSLGDAHQMVSDFEDQLLRELPQVKEINSHIEPAFEEPKPGGEQETMAKAELQSKITALVKEMPEMHSCHKFRIWPEEYGYKVTFHCRTDPQTTVGEAHRLAEGLEQEIYQQVPGVTKAVIHMEPEGG